MTQKIAHWVKDMFTFSAHSVRGASISAGMAKGVPQSDVLAMVD